MGNPFSSRLLLGLGVLQLLLTLTLVWVLWRREHSAPPPELAAWLAGAPADAVFARKGQGE